MNSLRSLLAITLVSCLSAVGCAAEQGQEDVDQSEGANTVRSAFAAKQEKIREAVVGLELRVTREIVFGQTTPPTTARDRNEEWGAEARFDFLQTLELSDGRASAARCGVYVTAPPGTATVALPRGQTYRIEGAQFPIRDGLSFSLELTNAVDQAGARAGTPADFAIMCHPVEDSEPGADLVLARR